MTSNPFGPGVSRFVSPRDTQFSNVIFQKRRPPLDSELNLLQSVEFEGRAEALRSEMPSGWLMNESNPLDDYTTNSIYSNLFFFGQKFTNELRSMPVAVVNGWTIPVAGTRTGQPPLNPNNSVTWNRIDLNPPSTSTGGNRAEFVFLEVWQQRIDVDPASPGIAPGKPTRNFIYRFGNVESGFSHIKDSLVDESLNIETTKRVQIQYRIRVVADINIAQFPEGFDTSLVFANGPKSSTGFPFANMREELGDPGLWRAGDGNPDSTGTVDGYVYSIPVCVVFRRNGSGFSDTGNLAGAFNRNSTATTRNNSAIFINQLLLPADIDGTTVQITLSSITGTVLGNMSSFGEAYFKIDEEIVRVTNITQTGPTSFVLNIDRGQLQTTVRSHLQNTALSPYTVRPDGLFADQIAGTDILDLRHSVADKFDYDSLLKTALQELLKGNLRTTWKRFGSTNASGNIILYGDRITDGTVNVGGLSRLDGPNGNRRAWSDAVTTERYNVSAVVPSNSASLGDPLQFTVSPYTIQVLWENAPTIHSPGNRLTGSAPFWYNGDSIRISKSNFVVGLPASDADQIRFVLPSEDVDAVLIHFEGMTTDPNGGIPSNPASTARSSTNPNLSSTFPIGNRILKQGSGLIVTLDAPTGDLIIGFSSGVNDTALQEFTDALQGVTNNAPLANGIMMHISIGVMCGAGRGLSHKPDYVHTVQYRGNSSNSSKVILRSGLADSNRMIPTYTGTSPLVQTGKNRTYSETSEVMIDPGSKTIYAAPYRNILAGNLLARNGTELNWFGSSSFTFQGAMPLLSPDGSTTVNSVVDPLNLFFHGNTSRYVEIPFEYLPKIGLHRIPIVPVSNSIYSSGINFMFMSKQGVPVAAANTSDFNKNLVSYPSGPGYYIVTAQVGETYGNNSGSFSLFGRKITRNQLRSTDGGPFQGIQFPPFLGPARITGIYLRNGVGVVPNPASPFNVNREFVGGSGTSANLLKDNFDGPTLLIETNENGDATFVVNKDVIDFTKVPDPSIVGCVCNPGDTVSTTKFNNTDFLIECTLFGFDRGWLETNGRFLVAQDSSGGSISMPIDTFTTAADQRVGLIVPAPLTLNATNNELTVYYSHQPYQGDVFGTQNAHSDDNYKLGPLSVSEALSIHLNPLGPVETLELPNKRGFEVLTAVNFVCSMGTGRLSGSVPIPLLTKEQNPSGPEDFSGTLIDLHRRFSLNRVGFEDWVTPLFPVVDSSFTSRPSLARGGLSEVFDRDLHPEYAGCLSQLPLGSYFRDKDFLGKNLYQIRTSSNIGQGSLGSLSYSPYQSASDISAPGVSSFEGIEFIVGNSSNTSGVGGEKTILVDGTGNFNSQSVFKTSRGGAGWSISEPWPGAPIVSKMLKAKPNSESGAVVAATAYLVRSHPEDVNNIEVHQGHELQMIIATEAIPAYFRKTDLLHSANGTGEGFTAMDRYRIWGRPLEKRRGQINADSAPLGDQPLFNNDIFDDPVFFGSADLNSVSTEQESLPILSDGQTVFNLTNRPLSAGSLILFRNGAMLVQGTDYTLSGPSLQNLTFLPTASFGSNPPLTISESLVAFYLVF